MATLRSTFDPRSDAAAEAHLVLVHAAIDQVALGDALRGRVELRRRGDSDLRADLAPHITRLMTNSNSCTASFTQHAGIAALQGDQTPVTEMVAEFKRRRDVLVAGLNRLPGVSCRSPRGAFYVFPNVKALKRPSTEIAEALLQEAGVAVLGGSAFGQYGEGYVAGAWDCDQLDGFFDRLLRARGHDLELLHGVDRVRNAAQPGIAAGDVLARDGDHQPDHPRVFECIHLEDEMPMTAFFL